ncbi:hypothetical protein [Amycolatopsis nivea]|uniref:hypothetical protein n=1 Tax=Amycolatopsis nivea TaxID=1644109 RepID=UPI00106FF93B|nr:hypothetical protein [Amycolatopsis nivea]
MGGRRPEELEPGETVLWTGQSPPERRNRWLRLGLLGCVLGLFVLGAAGGWDIVFRVAGIALTCTLLERYSMKRTLTRGRYTVTTRRVLVEGSWWGRPIWRTERLADLVKPSITDYRGGRAVEFGDREKRELTGHRASGALIAPLALFVGDEANQVLEVVRAAQKR